MEQLDKLIKILTIETQSLKAQYIEKIETWAKSYYSLLEVRKTWNEVNWCEYLGLTPEVKNPNSSLQFLGFPNNFYNSKISKRYYSMRDDIRLILGLGLSKYMDKERNKAILHYENSILKLADRIMKKGLNVDNLKVVTSHIGVNIETTLTDGIKTVRAFTIIAEGIVQCPHYRYLIK